MERGNSKPFIDFPFSFYFLDSTCARQHPTLHALDLYVCMRVHIYEMAKIWKGRDGWVFPFKKRKVLKHRLYSKQPISTSRPCVYYITSNDHSIHRSCCVQLSSLTRSMPSVARHTHSTYYRLQDSANKSRGFGREQRYRRYIIRHGIGFYIEKSAAAM